MSANSASATSGCGHVPLGDFRRCAGDERGEHQLGHVLGQRRDGREDERGRPAKKHRDRQRLFARLGDLVVEAAALADLPVHARRAADRARAGGTCPRLWPRPSGCSVKTSGSVMNGPPSSGHVVMRGQPIEPDVVCDDLGDRAAGASLQARPAAGRVRRRARPRAWPAWAAGSSRPARRAA